jgi:hypothetical protein
LLDKETKVLLQRAIKRTALRTISPQEWGLMQSALRRSKAARIEILKDIIAQTEEIPNVLIEEEKEPQSISEIINEVSPVRN